LIQRHLQMWMWMSWLNFCCEVSCVPFLTFACCNSSWSFQTYLSSYFFVGHRCILGCRHRASACIASPRWPPCSSILL
jgi:hypothetical protein